MALDDAAAPLRLSWGQSESASCAIVDVDNLLAAARKRRSSLLANTNYEVASAVEAGRASNLHLVTTVDLVPHDSMYHIADAVEARHTGLSSSCDADVNRSLTALCDSLESSHSPDTDSGLSSDSGLSATPHSPKLRRGAVRRRKVATSSESINSIGTLSTSSWEDSDSCLSPEPPRSRWRTKRGTSDKCAAEDFDIPGQDSDSSGEHTSSSSPASQRTWPERPSIRHQLRVTMPKDDRNQQALVDMALRQMQTLDALFERTTRASGKARLAMRSLLESLENEELYQEGIYRSGIPASSTEGATPLLKTGAHTMRNTGDRKQRSQMTARTKHRKKVLPPRPRPGSVRWKPGQAPSAYESMMRKHVR